MTDGALAPRPLESALFGCRVFATTVTSAADVDAAVGAMREYPDSLLVARVSASVTPAVWRLEQRGGQLCDVLLTMTRSIAAGGHGSIGTFPVTVRRGRSDDAPALSALGAAAFHGFPGHWHADERLPTHLADRLYAQWCADLARAARDEQPLFVAITPDEGITGFLALGGGESNRWHVPLTGVDPTFRGMGILPAMLDAAMREIGLRGVGQLDYETQLTNTSALRSVARCGFVPSVSRLTFHLWTESA